MGGRIADRHEDLLACHARLHDAAALDEDAPEPAPELGRVVYWGSGAPEALETLMATPGYETFVPCDTASEDVCLIAFTSGTTGEPKGTMHFHRDMLATCDSYGRYVLRAQASDRGRERMRARRIWFLTQPPPPGGRRSW